MLRHCLIGLLALGCGQQTSLLDDGGLVCSADSDCDDGLYCNGAERCDPHGLGTDVLGCVARPVPCDGSVCDESQSACFLRCTIDSDGDGARAMGCGGTDCDDHDAARRPGLPEICDARGRDEDCDPTTFGRVDVDGDGWLSAACCNGEHCGEDCDDSSATVFPGALESRNGRDDDCDGRVDEGVLQ